MSSAPTHAVMIWLRPDQAGLAREVARRAGLEVIAAGSPVRGQSGAVAAALECRAIDDLRAELAVLTSAASHRHADVVWLMEVGDLSMEASGEDARALHAAASGGVRVVCSEPWPAAALDLPSGLWSGETPAPGVPSAARFVPLLSRGPAFREAAEVLASFGNVRSLLVESWSGPSESTLGGALFNAMELIHGLLAEPETIDAAYVGPVSASGEALPAGESLRGLRGDLTANLRFSDGRAAAIMLSDQAGAWSRAVTLLGPGGRLRVTDAGFVWIDPSGVRTDEHRARGVADDPSAAGVIAESMTRTLHASNADAPIGDPGAVLAMAQAALLSARTGQPESPTTVRRMAENA